MEGFSPRAPLTLTTDSALGHDEHEWSSHSSLESVFKFLSERYKARLDELSAESTDGDDYLMGYAFNERTLSAS